MLKDPAHLQTLGKNIKTIRKRFGYSSQKDFVDFIEDEFPISVASLSGYESGNSWPGVLFMVLMQRMSGINVDDLCTRIIMPHEVPKEPISGKVEIPVPDRLEDVELTRENQLYYYPNLIEEVKNVRKRLDELERSMKDKG
jgi:transcriptional regulator with XRE-family HTH domain